VRWELERLLFDSKLCQEYSYQMLLKSISNVGDPSLSHSVCSTFIAPPCMNYLQSSVAEWLSLLRLAEYTSSLERQGYANIDSITDITWEDLEDIGITKLGTDRFCVLHILRTVSVT